MSDSPYIFDASAENFAERVIAASDQVPVLVDFWASWCGPCQALLPVVSKLAGEYQGKFLLAKVNIDEQQALAQQFAVRSVPTVKLVKHGTVVDEFTGALPEGQIRAVLDRHIERESDRQINDALALYQAGDIAGAIGQLSEAAEGDPDNPRVRRQLLRLLAEQGDSDAARQLLDAMSREERDDPEVQAIEGLLSFSAIASGAPGAAELETRITADAADCEARYQLSARHIIGGDYEAAMQQLLEIVRRDRKYGDDAGRKALLKVFELLGGQGELVTRYRAQMSSLLY